MRLSFVGRAFMGPMLDRMTVLDLWPTRTRLDVGLWWRTAPIWVFLLDEALLLVAWGTHTLAPRPWLRLLPFAGLRRNVYNHVTGELLLESADADDLPGLHLRPEPAIQILANIRQG